MTITKVGPQQLLPVHIEYLTKVVNNMISESLTNLTGFNHLLMYPNLIFVMAFEGKVPVGVLACSVQQQTTTCHVLVAYVSKDHQKKGVFKGMLQEIKKSDVIPQFKWNKITFGVMTGNKSMQKVMRLSGASPEATIYSISL